jgi:uncharacterized protein DUF1566
VEEAVGLFSRSKTAEPAAAKAQAVSAGTKIVLKFGGRASKAIEAIAAATLNAGGFDAARAVPKIGCRMPDGTIYAGTSPDTGNAMYAAPADAPLSHTFDEAQKYAKDLDAHGHRDWRVPSRGELNMLFNNRAAIGGFDVSGSFPAGRYWSASSDGRWGAWDQRFSNGLQCYNHKDCRSALRCVR